MIVFCIRAPGTGCDAILSRRIADKRSVRALSIRQPYAELILRGIKTVEYRTQPTRIIGERFYIYASKQKADFGELSRAVGSRQKVEAPWSRDLGMLQADLPDWMIELAEQVGMIAPGEL